MIHSRFIRETDLHRLIVDLFFARLLFHRVLVFLRGKEFKRHAVQRLASILVSKVIVWNTVVALNTALFFLNNELWRLWLYYFDHIVSFWLNRHRHHFLARWNILSLLVVQLIDNASLSDTCSPLSWILITAVLPWGLCVKATLLTWANWSQRRQICSGNSIVWWNVLLISWVILALYEKLLGLLYLLCCRCHIEFAFQIVPYGPLWLFRVLVGFFSNCIHGRRLGYIVCSGTRFGHHLTDFLCQVSLAATLEGGELAWLYLSRCLIQLFVIVSPCSLRSSISGTHRLFLTINLGCDQFIMLLGSLIFDLFGLSHEILTVVDDWCSNFPLTVAQLCLDVIRLHLSFPTVIDSFGEFLELSHGAWGFNKLTYSTANNSSKDWQLPLRGSIGRGSNRFESKCGSSIAHNLLLSPRAQRRSYTHWCETLSDRNHTVISSVLDRRARQLFGHDWACVSLALLNNLVVLVDFCLWDLEWDLQATSTLSRRKSLSAEL